MPEYVLKFIFAFLATVALGNCQEWPNPEFVKVTAPVSNKCLESTGLDINILNEARKGKLPDDDVFKKFLYCVHEEFGLIDRDHHDIAYWKILTMVPIDMKKPAFEFGKGCINVGAETDYVKAVYDFVACLYKHDPMKYTFMF